MFNRIKNNPTHMLIMAQINDVENCLIQFESFVRTICAGNVTHETLSALAKGIADAEATADISLRKMIDSLSNAAFLPATRNDIISIATSCDSVANKCEYYAVSCVTQNFSFPSEYAEGLSKIITISRKQFEILQESVSRLFSDFGGLLKDHSILDEIRALESEVDAIEQSMYKVIYAKDIDLAHKMQEAFFVEKICDISDIVENIADKIQIMLVTRKV